MSDKNNKTLKPGWRRVKFGDVVRLSKARSQDPLADGIERYVGLEHLEPGDLRIRSWGSVADGVICAPRLGAAMRLQITRVDCCCIPRSARWSTRQC